MKRTPLVLGLALIASAIIISLAWSSRTPPADPAAAAFEAAGAQRVETSAHYDPLELALATRDQIVNREAVVPPACYTRTDGIANPCWTCHSRGLDPNEQLGWPLQAAYSFSDFARENRWSNLFLDRRAEIAAISDEAITAWIAADNYGPLRDALQKRRDYPGYVPDLDLHAGVDSSGFARDGSGWRAVRFKPFPGTFWPTNGNVGDVWIRLPQAFQRTADGRPSQAVYRVNLAILEAAIGADPDTKTAALERRVEAIDEAAGGVDLDGDGTLGQTRTINGLPRTYVGEAAEIAVRRYVYPAGVEFLHPVRYLDPEQPGFMATRLKELRYAVKRFDLDRWARQRAYAEELEDKERGRLPVYAGGPEIGLLNDFGWQFQGFIEDARGRLRLQTEEEQLYCMGCHSALSVTVDSSFSFARKIPGAAGWGLIDANGLPDVPQAGHDEPETLTWFKRVTGGDEFRANDEIRQRFWPGGTLDEAAVRRAAPGGDRDMSDLIMPSTPRALALNKAYRVLIRGQRFDLGRDTVLSPPRNVHRRIDAEATDLAATGRVFRDGRLHLDWSGVDLP